MHSAIYLSLISFLLLLFIRNSLSCSCSYSHPQKAFCDGDFALKFKVIAKDLVESNDSYDENENPFTDDVGGPVIEMSTQLVRYTVCDLVIYQGFSKLYKVNKRYIFTIRDRFDSWCSLDLKVGKRYATIGGFLKSNRLHMYYCQYVARLDSLSGLKQRLILFNISAMYRWSCDHCKVHVCGGMVNNCRMAQPPDVCETERGFGGTQYDNAICVPLHRRGTCAWSFNDASSSPSR